MTIEEDIFQRKRFYFEKLEPFGFCRTDGGYVYVHDFMDGDFRAIVSVSTDGAVTGKVIDVANDEEYVQMRYETFKGAFVGSVREAYEDLLQRIATQCCKDVFFRSDQSNRLTEHIFETYGIIPDFPFDQDRYKTSGVFRHPENRKWFALLMPITWNALLKNGCKDPVDAVNLKIDPAQGDELRAIDGIFPAYHMSHKSWISVVLDDTLSDKEIAPLVDMSFALTK